MPFAIQDADDTFKFKNSETVVRYMLAAEQIRSGLALKLIDRIFTSKNSEGVSYQTMLNDYYTKDEIVLRLERWLKDAGLDENSVKEIRKIADYPETTNKMTENRDIIENQLRVKGIPTMIFDGKKHTGLWKAN